MPTPPIDRDKLRVFIRQLDGEDLLVLLDRAIRYAPQDQAAKAHQGLRPPR